MHSYCLFICWRASEITTHHEPVCLCLRRAADVVSVSGACRPFAWKMAAKGVVQVWKSLAWKIYKLKLALSSVPHALWGASPALLVLISATISSYNLPVLFQRNSQNSQNSDGALPSTCDLVGQTWGSCRRLMEGQICTMFLVSAMH